MERVDYLPLRLSTGREPWLNLSQKNEDVLVGFVCMAVATEIICPGSKKAYSAGWLEGHSCLPLVFVRGSALASNFGGGNVKGHDSGGAVHRVMI